jgi:dTDP-4-amino-4,6-dideoxygalactose transaminase
MDELAINGGVPASERMIPIAKPVFSEKSIQDVADIIRSNYVVQGPKVKLFEETFAQRSGVKYAYAVSSGTAALHVAYLSVLKPGEEVIVPSFTFIATASMVVYSNGKPVFSDIKPDTYIMDPEDVKEKISKRTRVLAPVNLFGNAADMKALEEIADDHSLVFVNDSCQAHGTLVNGVDVGTLPGLNCFSFYPSKSMTTMEGGLVSTDDKELYRLGTLLRAHGSDTRYHHIMFGLNYRLTEPAAAIGLDQLEKLDDFIDKRMQHGKVLYDRISKIDGLSPQVTEEGVTHSYSYFTLTLDPDVFKCSRDDFIKAVRAENISTAVHYPIPLTKQPAILDLGTPEPCPVSEDVADRIFSLPMYPGLTGEDLNAIVHGVEKVTNYYIK